LLDFGRYWNGDAICLHRAEILKLNAENARLFRRAYDYLHIAKEGMDLYERYIVESDALDISGLNEQTEAVMADVLNSETEPTRRASTRLFASAISPEGLVHHLDSLVSGVRRVYLVLGTPGTGRTTLIRKVAEKAESRGHMVEYYHCALDPSKIDHAAIPELGVMLVNCAWPHSIMPGIGNTVVDNQRYLRTERLAHLQGELAEAETIYRQALNNALSFISRAKKVHDDLERIYSKHMNFDQIEELRKTLLAQILQP